MKSLKKTGLTGILLINILLVNSQINTDRMLTIGSNALQFKDYVLSIQYFNQVINSKPYLTDPYILRASAKIQLGDFEGALSDCNTALTINPFIDYAYYLRGFSYKRLEKYKEASTDFTKALEFKPNDSTYILNRIETYERINDHKSAISDIDLYLKLNPKKIECYYFKGNHLLQLGDTLGALACFNRLTEEKPGSYLGWSARGLINMIRKDFAAAEKDYTMAIKNKSSYAGDYINRGIINNNKKNFKLALSDYDQAIKLDTTEFLAYYNRGILRGFVGDYNNALTDFAKAFKLDSTKTEALLNKALIEESLNDFKNSIADYKLILQKYPYYIPAYQEIANIEEKRGNLKAAYTYRQKAKNIDLNKDYLKNKNKLSADNQMVVNTQKSGITAKSTKLFYQLALQNNTDSTNISNENSDIKGNVQDRFTNLTNEEDFILSFITFKYQYRRTNLFHTSIQAFNKMRIVPISLGISNIELTVNSDLVNIYFTAIKQTTDSINLHKENPFLYFSRALEFTAVKDYIGALEDMEQAIKIKPDFSLAIFAKANIENKLSDKKIELTPGLNSGTDKIQKLPDLKQNLYSKDMILKEYNKVIELSPDFSFAYYNKANILCTQKNFQSAILNYTQAIKTDTDFAEAYFNRGLTYLLIGEDAKGLADLSKAGELGIYKAYNLIQRFKK